ncbi:TetR family transcriptional regulator, partial [Bacillus licheniformis]|nr:TetR family transcriptional regulator [Bacillus licheniformis]
MLIFETRIPAMSDSSSRIPLSPRKAPRQRRSVATVDAIVEAAARILERDGFDGYTTNAVAALAGVSIGSLYQYFPNRDALTAALVERESAHLLDDVDRAAALSSCDDVLRTLVPLLVSGIVTLEMCVVLGMSLNFANIIALPLMLGVGVAFKVYFVMAWRAGQTGLLHSSLTHAVLFSAATTATAFGSLWLSHHPGTSSMGKLLALALTCTLIGAVEIQPDL